MDQKKLYIGIELNYDRAMVSFFREGMTAPETDPLRMETDIYGSALTTDDPLLRYQLIELIKRLIALGERFQLPKQTFSPYVAITVPHLTEQTIALLYAVQQELGIPVDSFQLMENGESFFAYVFHQDALIRQHDVALFDFDEDVIRMVALHADGYSSMRRVSATEQEWELPSGFDELPEKKDLFFSQVLKQAFSKRIVSGVYLVGDGFDGDWMKETLRVLGPNRRVFCGKNLYTLGACYAAYRNEITSGWNFYYDGEYKMKGEVSLKVLKDQKPHFLRLVGLGENWFAPRPTHYFLYEGDPKLEVWVRVRDRMNAQIHTFVLQDVPQREARSVRLKLHAEAVSAKEVRVCVCDDGFGDLFERGTMNVAFEVVI